ncbi:MAG: hypothetical protein ACYTFK_14320, partial [Planctomycetota bacterium]
RPDGLFLLGAPNAANLLKRFRVPLGENIFAKIEDWYMYEKFIGHVREPVVADLLYICKDLELEVLRIIGRNWIGLKRVPKGMKIVGYSLDKILRLFPSLCSNIFILAAKSKQEG